MARTKQITKRDDEGDGSDQSRISAKDKGKGVADQPRSKVIAGSRRSKVRHSEDHVTS